MEIFRNPWVLALPAVIFAVLAVAAFVDGSWVQGLFRLALALLWTGLARLLHRTNQARKQGLTP